MFCSSVCYKASAKEAYFEKKRKQRIPGTPEHEQFKVERYSSYVSGANSRGISFYLTFEEFLTFWQKPCSYCGSPIESVGIDRLNSKRPYMKGNTVSCCSQCNQMKWIYTPNQYLAHCRRVTNHFKDPKSREVFCRENASFYHRFTLLRRVINPRFSVR